MLGKRASRALDHEAHTVLRTAVSSGMGRRPGAYLGVYPRCGGAVGRAYDEGRGSGGEERRGGEEGMWELMLLNGNVGPLIYS